MSFENLFRHRFQSTLPYGSDHYFPTCKAVCPISIHAPLRERPCGCCGRDGHHEISIHAPLRERRQKMSTTFFYGDISIHAPLRERRYIQAKKRTGANFNPRSLTGATPAIMLSTRLAIFQSTLPYGSDLSSRPTRPTTIRFQSTLPYGSDKKIFRNSAAT